MTAFLAIAGILLEILLAWFKYLTGGQEQNAALVTQLKGTLDEIQKASAARQTVRDRIAVKPDSVREPTAEDRPFDPDGVG